MRLRLLPLILLAPALYGQPGLMTVQAGALSCGAVLRAVDQIQTYCRLGSALVHNTISTANTQLVVTYEWCVGPDATPAGCTYSSVTWEFARLSTPRFGMSYQVVTRPGGAITSGSLTAVYGTLTGDCSQITAPWSGVTTLLDGSKVPLSIWMRNGEICSTVQPATGFAESRCPLVNLFQECGGVLIPLRVVAM